VVSVPAESASASASASVSVGQSAGVSAATPDLPPPEGGQSITPPIPAVEDPAHTHTHTHTFPVMMVEGATITSEVSSAPTTTAETTGAAAPAGETVTTAAIPPA